jgi:hypothetical protein
MNGLTVLKNVKAPWVDDVMHELSDLPMMGYYANKNWKEHGTHLFWSDFRPAANFVVLRNMIRTNNIAIKQCLCDFLEIAKSVNYSRASEADNVWIMKCLGDITPHVDMPHRKIALNWFPFPTHGFLLTVGEETYSPKQGDVILIDVARTHSTTHFSTDPIYMVSL